jgi:tetratricopeptide (TPR) repeat protein
MYKLTGYSTGKKNTAKGRLYMASAYLLLAWLCFTATGANAQTGLNFRTVEDSSYALYLKHDWKQLQKFGQQAIRQHIDYFYLRQRIGIAYYEQKKYQAALPQFLKAGSFNSADELLQEYIFYSLAFDGRYDEALRFSKRFGKDLQAKTNTKKPAPINYVTADFTVKVPQDPTVAYAFYNIGVGFNHRITKGYSAFHAYSYSWQKYTGGLYSQHRYYLALNIPLKKGFALQPAFSLLADQYSDTTLVYPRPPNPPGPPKRQISRQTYFSFIGSLNVSKILPYVRIDLGNAFSNLDTNYQIQHSLGLTVYPLGNQKLALSGNVIIHTRNFYKSVHPLVQGGLRFNAPQFFALSIVYTYANVYNFHIYNGYLVQNGYDLLKGNLLVAPEFIIKRRYSIYAAYQFETKTARETGLNYFTHGISIGTKLKF